MLKMGLVYQEDWRSLVIVLLGLLAIYLPFIIYLPPYLVLLWIYLCSWFYTLVSLVNHNHQHVHVFKYNILNYIINLLMSAVLFFPSCIIYLAHNVNHHQYSGDKNDWVGVHVGGIGTGFERLLRCYLVGLVTMKKGQKKADAPQWPEHIYNILKVERCFVILLVLTLLYIDWSAFVLFALIPNMLGLKRVFEYNHILHDNGCDLTKMETASHNSTSKLSNWFFFNAGFHTAHHMRPLLHWSLLPELHNEIKHQIPAQYLHHSVVAFYIHYLFTYKAALDE